MDNLHTKLVKIQKELKAPKNQENAFGKYKYRSCEDILEAVKPFLDGLHLLLSDEVVCVGTKNYVKATAFISDGKELIKVDAYAREAEEQKGMSPSQITGAASSYARKYALNGLFAIDDTKDADTMDNRSESVTQPSTAKPAPTNEPMCSIHNRPMKQRTAQNGGHYYDHRWLENDVWKKCNGKPKAEEWDGEIPDEF